MTFSPVFAVVSNVPVTFDLTNKAKLVLFVVTCICVSIIEFDHRNEVTHNVTHNYSKQRDRHLKVRKSASNRAIWAPAVVWHKQFPFSAE